jgi:hypothetical protein
MESVEIISWSQAKTRGCIIRVVDAMPEDEDGELPEDTDIDKPDEWRDVCDDPSADPHSEDEDG